MPVFTHSWHARFNSDHHVGQSQVVIINVLKGDGLMSFPAEEGQTLVEIGDKLGIPPDKMAGANPGVDPTQPLQGGQPVQIPSGETGGDPVVNGVQPPEGPIQLPSNPPTPIVFWLNQKLLPNPKSIPQEPNLGLALIDCRFRLYITPQSENAAGFNVYRLKTGDAVYQKIAVLGPGKQSIPIIFDDEDIPADLVSYSYYIGAFNGNGETPSQVVYQPGKSYECKQPGPVQISLIHWKFQVKEPVDKYYCYQSTGAGKWEKMPKQPFDFFNGVQFDYPQYDLVLPGIETALQVQCWGWLGGELKFLGQGEAKFDPAQPVDLVMVNTDSIQVVGVPQIKTKPDKMLGGGQLTVPPPFAVREPSDSADCAKHFGNILAGFVCNDLLKAPIKQFTVIEWEWEPRPCLPVGNCAWVNDIDGYLVYEIDPSNNTEKNMKSIGNITQKVSALPVAWGYRCYGIKAYAEGAEYNGHIYSDMAIYCPGKPPQPEKIVLQPINWLTTGGTWLEDGCDSYGTADAYQLANKKNGFGNNGEVLVGSYIVDDDDGDCFKQGDYSGGVKFGQPDLPTGAIVQKAVLKYSDLFTQYKASGVATNYKLFCVSGVGKAKQDWTKLGSNHFVGKNILFSVTYNTPLTTLSGWGTKPEVDVTSVVKGWIKNPLQNHGLILTPASAPKPATDGSGICESAVGNFQLEIYYFIPPP